MNPNSERVGRLVKQMLTKIKMREATRAQYLVKYEREKAIVRAAGGCVGGVTLRAFRNTGEHALQVAPQPSERLKPTTRDGQLVFLPPSAEFADWCSATEGGCCDWSPPFPFPRSNRGMAAVQRLGAQEEARREERARAAEQVAEAAEQDQLAAVAEVALVEAEDEHAVAMAAMGARSMEAGEEGVHAKGEGGRE